jgi:hypothetical protein
MCAYAGDVARGELPGPYTDADARLYARACLIPTELLERPTLDVHSAAAALGVPADELQAARAAGGQRLAKSGPVAVGAGQAVVDVDALGGDAERGRASRWAVRSCASVETRA